MKILTVFLLLFLSACATDPLPLQQLPQESSVEAFGSLSDTSNPADVKASVVYTRLAVYQHNAARLLRKKLITVGAAILAQTTADRIRSDLDTALKKSDIALIDSLSQQLADAENSLEVSK